MSKIESLLKPVTLRFAEAAAGALQTTPQWLMFGDAATVMASLPIALELVDGSVKDQGGLPAEGPAPRQEFVRVACAGEDWRALRVSQAARIDLGATAAYDLRAGDLLVMMPTGEAETGDLVVATKTFSRTAKGEAFRGLAGAARPRQLRVVAPGPDGRTWLWPLQGDDQPIAAEPLEAPWEIVEVAVEQRRGLRRLTGAPIRRGLDRGDRAVTFPM